MGIVSGHRIIHNLMAGNLSGAQLATYLNTGNNKASYQQAILSSSQIRALSASPIGIEAALSAGVMVGSLLNQIAIRGGAAHTPELETAEDMAAVAASTAAMEAVAASTAAKMACFNSDIALAAFADSATALTALRAVDAYSVISKTAGSGAQTIPGPTAGQSYILLEVSDNSGMAAQSITNITTRRSGSTRPITVADSADSTTSAQTVTLCTPLVSPFTFTTSDAATHIWYFGLLRCDI